MSNIQIETDVKLSVAQIIDKSVSSAVAEVSVMFESRSWNSVSSYRFFRLAREAHSTYITRRPVPRTDNTPQP